MPDKETITYDFEEDTTPERLSEKSERRFKEGWRKAGDPRQIEIRFPNGRSTVRYSQVFLKAAPADGGAWRVRRCLGLEPGASAVPWGEFRPCEHWVQVYPEDDDLMESLVGFVRDGERAGDAMVLIASSDHRQMLTRLLAADGMDVEAAIAGDRLILLDAESTLESFMAQGAPDPEKFRAVIGAAVARARSSGRPVRAFGEMVAILWDRGQHAAMMQLEHIWHVYCQRDDLALFCAYPRRGFDARSIDALQGICGAHSRVVG